MHPNASVTAVTGSAGALLVYLLHRYASIDINAVEGAGIATAIAAVFLFVGRRGIKGTLSGIWHGSESAKKK